MGVALSPATVPAAGKPGFTLGEDEIELGLGIHGEAGIRRARMEPADRLTKILLDRIIAQKALSAGDRVALLVNNLGATPPMEIAIMARAALALLKAPISGWNASGPGPFSPRSIWPAALFRS